MQGPCGVSGHCLPGASQEASVTGVWCARLGSDCENKRFAFYRVRWKPSEGLEQRRGCGLTGFYRIPLVALVRIDFRGQGGWEKGLRAGGETCIEGRLAKTASRSQGMPKATRSWEKATRQPSERTTASNTSISDF